MPEAIACSFAVAVPKAGLRRQKAGPHWFSHISSVLPPVACTLRRGSVKGPAVRAPAGQRASAACTFADRCPRWRRPCGEILILCIERPPRNTGKPRLSGGGHNEAVLRARNYLPGESWTMRSVADAKRSATRNASVASCDQPSSCLVDDNFHLGSVSNAVKCHRQGGVDVDGIVVDADRRPAPGPAGPAMSRRAPGKRTPRPKPAERAVPEIETFGEFRCPPPVKNGYRVRFPIGREPFDLLKPLGARFRPQRVKAGRQVFHSRLNFDSHAPSPRAPSALPIRATAGQRATPAFTSADRCPHRRRPCGGSS